MRSVTGSRAQKTVSQTAARNLCRSPLFLRSLEDWYLMRRLESGGRPRRCRCLWRSPLARPPRSGRGSTAHRVRGRLERPCVTRDCYSINVPEQLVDAHSGAVLRIIQVGRNRAAAPQWREPRVIVLAGALDIQDCVAGGSTALACHFGAKLARRAEFNVIQKKLFVHRVGATLDDDIVRL